MRKVEDSYILHGALVNSTARMVRGMRKPGDSAQPPVHDCHGADARELEARCKLERLLFLSVVTLSPLRISTQAHILTIAKVCQGMS